MSLSTYASVRIDWVFVNNCFRPTRGMPVCLSRPPDAGREGHWPWGAHHHLLDIPDWYYDISPTGKVPLLKQGDDVVWESTVINEFLEDAYPAWSWILY